MKYKLINKTTGEETLCDKVTIDGFDYYVSDEIPKEDDVATIPSYASLVIVGSIDDMPYSESHRHWQGLFCNTCFDVEAVSKFKKVIATNNPNIDIPKVVDEVEKLAHEYFAEERDNWEQENPNGIKSPQSLIEHYNRTFTPIFRAGYNKSQETHPFSGEDMIEFYEWCNYPIYRADRELGFRSRVQAQFPEYNTYVVIDETGYSIHPKGVFLTTEELLQLWKDQKPKTVYCS